MCEPRIIERKKDDSTCAKNGKECIVTMSRCKLFPFGPCRFGSEITKAPSKIRANKDRGLTSQILLLSGHSIFYFFITFTFSATHFSLPSTDAVNVQYFAV